MHILVFILMFVVGSIVVACDGDFSGIKAIGKVIFFPTLDWCYASYDTTNSFDYCDSSFSTYSCMLFGLKIKGDFL